MIQSASAASVALPWLPVSDGALVTSQTIAVAPSSGFTVDPRDASALTDNTQYSVVAVGVGGTIDGVVIELATGGDTAMMYEGFTGP